MNIRGNSSRNIRDTTIFHNIQRDSFSYSYVPTAPIGNESSHNISISFRERELLKRTLDSVVSSKIKDNTSSLDKTQIGRDSMQRQNNNPYKTNHRGTLTVAQSPRQSLNLDHWRTTDNPNIKCSQLVSHLRANSPLPMPFQVLVQGNVRDGTKVTLSCASLKNPNGEMKHNTAHTKRIETKTAKTFTNCSVAVFDRLKFVGKSGRGEKFTLTIFVHTDPAQIARYENAVKVTADGPRPSRNKATASKKVFRERINKQTSNCSPVYDSFVQENSQFRYTDQKQQNFEHKCVYPRQPPRQITSTFFQPQIASMSPRSEEKWLSNISEGRDTIASICSSTPEVNKLEDLQSWSFKAPLDSAQLAQALTNEVPIRNISPLEIPTQYNYTPVSSLSPVLGLSLDSFQARNPDMQRNVSPLPSFAESF